MANFRFFFNALLKIVSRVMFTIGGIQKLVIVRVDGGICSQMHFYLVGQLWAERGYTVKYDLAWYRSNGVDLNGKDVRNFDLLKAFPNIELSIPTKIESCFHRCFKYNNKKKSLDILQEGAPLWLIGYYPRTGYMLEQMLPYFFKVDYGLLNEKSKLVLKDIRSKYSPIAVHIRRGDLTGFNSAYGYPVPNEYFSSSIKYVESIVPEPYFFFFSDDISWVKNILVKELPLNDNYQIVEGNNADKGYMDMFLISSCNHQITSKGSLGKYGGLLHCGDNKIIIYNDEIEYRKWNGLSEKFVFLS